MKCDEEKPACSRCRKGGRTCDGYSNKTQASLIVSTATSESNDILFPNRRSYVAIAPCTQVTGTEQERRGFDFFHREMGIHLTTSLKLTVLYRFVLQKSHSDLAVKSAVIALASVGERSQLKPSETRQAESCLVFAHHEYGNAIRHLRNHFQKDNEGSEVIALLICLLFLMTDYLQGNKHATRLHLECGLKILRQRQITSTSAISESQNTTQEALRDEIHRAFAMFDSHVSVWAGQRLAEPSKLPKYGPDAPFGRLSIPEIFTTLDQAADAINSLTKEALQFQRSVIPSGWKGSPNQVPSHVRASQQHLIEQTQQWNKAMEALRAVIKTELDDEGRDQISVMKMNYLITLVHLRAAFHRENDLVYYKFEEHFRSVVELAATVLEIKENDGERVARKIQRIVCIINRCKWVDNIDTNPRAVYDLYVGVIAPLCFVAGKCQNSEIQEEAITLLSEHPWREGVWNSSAMATIVRDMRNSQE